MTIFNINKSAKKYLPVIAFFISAAYLILVYHFLGFYFETNDDRQIAEILSGALTGSPESRTSNMNCILGFPLAFLYKITTNVPWYGLMLVLFLFLCYGFLLESLYLHCKTTVDFIFSSVLVASIFLCSIYTSSLLQYTCIASMIAICGYVCLFLQPEPKKKYIVFFLFEFLAYALRDKAMLMIQPFGLALFVGLLWTSKKLWRNKLREFLFVCLTIVLSVFLGFLGHNTVYHQSEWKEYERFHKCREQLFDFYGTPSYDSVTDILNKYNVSKAEYEAFQHYTILDGNINSDCLEELVEFTTSSHQIQTDWSVIFSQIVDTYFGNGYWMLGRVTIIAWFIFLLLAILRKQYQYLFPAIMLCFAHFFVWGFLFYRGRIVNRVCLPLYLCEIIFLTILFWLCCRDSSEKSKAAIITRILSVAGCIILLYGSYQTGVQQYRYATEQISMQKIFWNGMYEIQEYCYSYPEQRFILESNSMSYYRGNALDTKVYKTRNNILSGGWYSNSPAHKNYVRNYLSNDYHDFYLIRAESDDPMFRYSLVYLSELSGSSPIIVDKFTASHGGTYLVYYYE